MKALNTFWKTSLLMILAATMSQCSREDEPDPIIITKSSDKQITSFVFLLSKNAIANNVAATIDEENKTITATMPPETDVTGLLPDIETSLHATVSPNTVRDFTNPLTYTVTAEDESAVIYTVTITVPFDQKRVLMAILDANPGNTLDWNITAITNLGFLEGVRTDENGDIVELNLYGKKLRQLPPEIGHLTKLEVLTLLLNNLTSVPSELGYLVNLKTLNLSRNEIVSLPEEIGFLTKLEDLEIDENFFSAIPQCICNLPEFNNPDMLYEKNSSDICATTSQMDALISIYSSNPGNTLGWGMDNFPGVTFGSAGSIRNIEIKNKGIERIQSGLASLSLLRLLDVRNNPLGIIPTEVCKLGHLTILTDPGEGCEP